MEKMFELRNFTMFDKVEEINEMLESGWSVKSVTMASSDGEFRTIVVLKESKE